MAKIQGQYVVMIIGQHCHDCGAAITPGDHAYRGEDGDDRCLRCDRKLSATPVTDQHSCPHCGCSSDKPVQVPGGPGPYTHIVKRADGYIAGWFRGEPPADFITECNANVPGNPAHVEELGGDWPESFTDKNSMVYCAACDSYEHPADKCPHLNDDDPATQPVTGAPLPDVTELRDRVTSGETSLTEAQAEIMDSVRTRHEIDSRPQSEGNPYTPYTPESRVFEIAQRHGVLAAEDALSQLQPDQEGYRTLIREIPSLRTWPGSSASEPKLRRDDLPGYALADLMSQAGWVPHDGTMLRDDLASQYESQARIAFWNGVEQAALAGFRGHMVVENTTQLGQRFLICACSHRTSGGIGDDIAQRNMDYHMEQVMAARRAAS